MGMEILCYYGTKIDREHEFTRYQVSRDGSYYTFEELVCRDFSTNVDCHEINRQEFETEQEARAAYEICLREKQTDYPIPKISPIRVRMSFSAGASTFAIFFRVRAYRSIVLCWSTRTTPMILLAEIGTLFVYPLLCDVIGHTVHSPLTAEYARTDITTAGRFPACSWPRVGEKSTQITSPASGIYLFTILHSRQVFQSQPTGAGFSCPCPESLSEVSGFSSVVYVLWSQ